VEKDPSFRVTGHILEFHGWCGACERRSRRGVDR
jgi:Fe2+ or Zn2+ uptake regulation protein